MDSLLKAIKSEWAVIRGAPWSVVTLMLLCFGVGVAVAAWGYSREVASLTADKNLYKDKTEAKTEFVPTTSIPTLTPSILDSKALNGAGPPKKSLGVVTRPEVGGHQAPLQAAPPVVRPAQEQKAFAASDPIPCPPGTGFCFRNSSNINVTNSGCIGSPHCFDAANETGDTYRDAYSVNSNKN